MKILEVVMTEDDYSQNLEDDITNLLVAISAEGIGEVDMDQLKTDLQNMGYTIDTKSLFNIVSNLPVVSNASYNKIELVTDVDTTGDDPAQDTEDDDQKTVDDLADKQVKKDLE
jgi:imidazole glycerol phosphate synthase subunit HisF